uniref:Venom peptide n=1 Tax=Caenorhabditis tropicalis TaxID=1561998 RepID=A0A1I7T135_9PELO
MLRSTFVLALLIFAIVGLIQCQPIQDNSVYGVYNDVEEAEAPYLMNLLKRTAVFFPSGNHDKMIKAILKSRRY